MGPTECRSTHPWRAQRPESRNDCVNMIFCALMTRGPLLGSTLSINTIGIVPVYACKVCDAVVASCATTG